MNEPEWVRLLADNAMVSTKELGEWLGRHPNRIREAALTKGIPSPDHMAVQSCGSIRHACLKWKVKTIRDWIKAGKPHC